MQRLLLISFYFLSITLPLNAQWIELGANSVFNQETTIAIDNSGYIYAAAGDFVDSNGKYYVAKWNGVNWSELGTGANALNANAQITSIAIDDTGNLYAVGGFTDSTGLWYVAKWNGTKWSKMLGENISNYIDVATDVFGNIYAVLGQDSNLTTYVAKWDGKSSSKLIAKSDTINSGVNFSAIAIDKLGNVYVAGYANSTSYVAQWKDSIWVELGTGGNGLNANNVIFSITTDDSGNVYVGGLFTNANGKTYVAKWNGIGWSEVGANDNVFNANYAIYSLAFDSDDNLYASGALFYSSGKVYISKWDGVAWIELGDTSFYVMKYGGIDDICIDNSGNVYVVVAGDTTTSEWCVAEYRWNAAVTGIANTTSSITITAYPNPTNGSLTITSPEAGQVVVYNTLGETVATQNVVQGNNLISFEKAPNGIYTLILTGQNGNYTPVKIVKD